MSYAEAFETGPRLGAVLVVHNGIRWLPVILGTIAEWRINGLELVVVDNASTDGSDELLEARVSPDRLIRLDEPVSFSEAVAVARHHPALQDAPLLLLLHDDLVMTEDAVTTLLATIEAEGDVAIAGPKLREWSQEPIVQQVGQRVDPFGRLVNELEPGEIDQGQHDEETDTLFVSTAGMIVRTDVIDALGGFDPRMTFQRDDLDLCWRAWLAGFRVKVVPLAIGYHVGAGERGGRALGDARLDEVPYLTDRHTLAAVLKNYSFGRLALIVPLGMFLVLLRVIGFVLTRRVGLAVATVRAIGWNILRLPRTLLLRRRAQRLRRRTDHDLAPLFASPFARARDLLDGFTSWITGARTPGLLEDPYSAPIVESRTFWAFLRRHPVAIVGPILLIVYVVGLLPLLGAGQIIGGQVLPWPAAARDFLTAYTNPWNGDPLGSAAFPSPVQAALGLMSLAGFGQQWLAQRLVVLGMLPLAWLLTIRAGRLLTTRIWPRLLGATIYTLSPPLLGALAAGRFSELLLGALLPGLVVVAVWAADHRRKPSEGWRAAALMALALVVLWSAAPGAWMVPAGIWLIAVLVAAVLTARRDALVRVVSAAVMALAVLSPWLVDTVRTPGQVLASTPFVSLPAWRSFLIAPDVLPGVTEPASLVAAGTFAAIIGMALLLTNRGRAVAVVALLVGMALWGLVAWGLSFTAPRTTWIPALLLPSALAAAGLGTLAARSLSDHLRHYAFGLRQILAGICAVALTLGLGAGAALLATGSWSELVPARDLVPAFVAADGDRVGPYRIMLLSGNEETLRWDVVDDDGPSMVEFGTTQSGALSESFGNAVAALGSHDPRAAHELGRLNIRYVVIHDRESSDALARVLAAQPDLEPLASGAGQIFAVKPWLPRAVLVPRSMASSADEALRLVDTAPLEETGLQRVAPGTYTGEVEPGWLLIAEAPSPRWDVQLNGRALDRVTDVNGAVYEVEEAGRVEVLPGSVSGHRAVVLAQVVLVFLIISLAIRPPRSGVDRRAIDDVHAGPMPAPMPGPAARAAAAATITGDLSAGAGPGGQP